MPATPQTNYESAIDKAIQRERLIQERALEIVKSFGPQIGSGSGMQPSHFISEAFRFAESFTVFCEQRELAIQVELESKAVSGPITLVPRPAELVALLPTATNEVVQGTAKTVTK